MDAQLAALTARLEELSADVTRLRALDLAHTTVASGAVPHDERDVLLSALWTAHAPLHRHPLVTVIMPTHLASRQGRLRSAIDSVIAQSYREWELLVVDNSADGMLREPPDWWPDDPRVRVLTSSPHDGGAARNMAVDAAGGQLIAYLDDDCVWFPWWVHAAVAALQANPAAAFVYGIRLSGGAGLAPEWVHAAPLTPLSLHVGNPIDTNVLVHRAGIDARWQPHMPASQDYDLAVQLSVQPHEFVPVPACAYATDEPTRIWAAGNDHTAEVERVRHTARTRRPLRVVAANALYPLITETYIGDELEGLRRSGVDVVLARQFVGPTPCVNVVDAPLYDSVDAAIEAHDPDVVLCHWAQTADWAAAAATAHGIPHAVRLHSFCAERSTASIMNEWCVGMWSLPGDDRTHAYQYFLPTMLLHPPFPGDDADRDHTLLSVSAGLPKKDFPRLLAAAHLADADLSMIVGTTRGWEQIPDELRAMAAASPARAEVVVDLPHLDALDRLRHAGAAVYNLAPDVPFGQPRSVLEAALCATPLVLPEHPALRTIAGDTAHYFTIGDVGTMAAAIGEALHRPHPLADRLALAESVRAAHSGTAHFERWRDELTAAVVRWQADHTPGPSAAAARWWASR